MVMATTRFRWVWISLSFLFVAIHIALALWYFLDKNSATEDRLLGALGVGVFPAVAFAVAVVPLFRGSRNGVAYGVGAMLAIAAAFLQGMLTFGLSFPFGVVLLGLAAVDGSRASKLMNIRRGQKAVLVALALALVVAPTLSLELALIAAAVIVGYGVWALISTRSTPPTHDNS